MLLGWGCDVPSVSTDCTGGEPDGAVATVEFVVPVDKRWVLDTDTGNVWECGGAIHDSSLNAENKRRLAAATFHAEDQLGGPEIGVFTAPSLRIEEQGELRGSGWRPLGLRIAGDVEVEVAGHLMVGSSDCFFSGSRADALCSNWTVAATCQPGPGGYAPGRLNQNGDSPGGGRAGIGAGGGGGGGFGDAGGSGGGLAGGAGGTPYGDADLSLLLGGAGGGGGASSWPCDPRGCEVSGGAGGGALWLAALGAVRVSGSGTIESGGGGGMTALDFGAGGGGSGGSIVLEASSVLVEAQACVGANGGGGGGWGTNPYPGAGALCTRGGTGGIGGLQDFWFGGDGGSSGMAAGDGRGPGYGGPGAGGSVGRIRFKTGDATVAGTVSPLPVVGP